MKAFPNDGEFLDAPIEPCFFNPVPEKGFRLVDAGTELRLEEVLPCKASLRGEARSVKVIAIPRGYEDVDADRWSARRFPLLLPQGGLTHARNAFVDSRKTPLFVRFSELSDEQSTLTFANEFGCLVAHPSVDLRGEPGVARLEPLSLWTTEAAKVRAVMNLVAMYEDGEPLHEYIRHDRDNKRYVLCAEGFKAYSIPFEPSLSLRDAMYRCLVRLFNEELSEKPVVVFRGIEEGKVKSVLQPCGLLAAIWLQLSQSFFGDGPEEIIVRRCFITGKYYPIAELSRRYKGPHAGKFYDRRMWHRFLQQERTREKARAEGREVTKNRKDKTRFVVSDI